MTDAAEELKAAELKELAQDLLSRFRNEVGATDSLTQPRSRRKQRITVPDYSRLVSVTGLARHVHELADGVLLLVDAKHRNVALPLVRSAMECALTSVWLAQSEDDAAVLSFTREGIRLRRATVDNMRNAASEVFRNGADQIPDVDMSLVPKSDDDDVARNFQRLCADLTPAGDDAYVLYRLLSSYAHASTAVPDLYWESGVDEESELYALPKPKEVYEDGIVLGLTISSMIWASRAFSYFLSPDRRRIYGNYLRAQARKVGIKDDIQLSEAYWIRKNTHRRSPKS